LALVLNSAPKLARQSPRTRVGSVETRFFAWCGEDKTFA